MIFVSQPSIGMLERRLVNECLDNCQLTYGPMTRRFEAALQEYLGVRHVLATSSGTTALHLALVALGIGPGHEVLVPDLTFVATANAVFYTGAKPVLVDVDLKTWNIDPMAAADKITKRTKAILPVHLYGVPCDMTALRELARTNNMSLLEDAAEGLGGFWGGEMLGSIGEAGVFSFYGNKILTTGEGGAVVTDDDDLAKRLFLLRGQALDPKRRYFHSEIGFNYRMTDLQAAIGVGQLSKLPEMIARRRDIIKLYQERLGAYGYASIAHAWSGAPWLFTMELHPDVDRNELADWLWAAGIETRPTFVPLHRLPMYRRAGTDRDFPNASRIGDRGISLPTYPGLTFPQINEICDAVIRVLTAQEMPCTR